MFVTIWKILYVLINIYKNIPLKLQNLCAWSYIIVNGMQKWIEPTTDGVRQQTNIIVKIYWE